MHIKEHIGNTEILERKESKLYHVLSWPECKF